MRMPPSHHLQFDERPIRFLSIADFDVASVGRDGCVEIRLVMEPGEMSLVPWFEVVGEGDVVLSRINGRFVSVVGYDTSGDEAKKRNAEAMALSA